MAKRRLILAAVVIGLIGCAAGPNPSSGAAHREDRAPEAATKPQGKAALDLDDIEPRVVLPPGKGSSVGQAPIEAVHLYAQAQEAILDNDRAAATALLQAAVAKDPLSYELHVALAHLYLTPKTGFSVRSIDMLEKAAELDPDHLDLQTDLGRQYLAKGNTAAAMSHFRTALLTRQYKSDAPAAAVAEYFLAQLLRKEGYYTAALDVYQRLAVHLKAAEMSLRIPPEVQPLLEQAGTIDVEIVNLLTLAGRFPEAITVAAGLIERSPGDFQLRSRHVHLLASIGRHNEAVTAAEAAAVYFRADSASIALLNEACTGAGLADGAVGALTRLHKARPNDHGILYALADLLRAEKRDDDARKLLNDAAENDAGDFEIVRRQIAILMRDGDRTKAARLLVHSNAMAPDSTIQLATLWNVLARPTSRGRLRWVDLQAIDVPKADEPAKWFWISRMAASAHRQDIARDALAKAAGFLPAFRDRLDEIWNREDQTIDAKKELTRQLAKEAGAAGGESYSHEIIGLGFVRQGDFAEAAASFARAMELGGRSADLLLVRADVLRRTGDDTTADSLLWKLISDHPSLNDAYLDLYLSSIRRRLEDQAERVVTLWIAAEPDSVTAWRSQALQYQRGNRNDAAETILVRVFNEHAEDAEAVEAMGIFLLRQKHGERFIKLLQERHDQDRGNFAVSSALAESLVGAGQGEQAVKVADAARTAAGSDSDLLYTISGLYARIGAKQPSEDVLQQVLKIDPAHCVAANDLGYLWADDGRKLPEAEKLIRQAVKADPQNISFLDSMGWVLYKRGQFDEARQYLDRAIGNKETDKLSRSDPTMLDHRGDVLYRLGNKEAAGKDWQRAADGIAAIEGDANSETKSLQKVLLEKSRRLKDGQEVPVAPIAEK